MPFFATGLAIGSFSFAANTVLTQAAGILFACGSLIAAISIQTHYTKELHTLKQRLVATTKE